MELKEKMSKDYETGLKDEAFFKIVATIHKYEYFKASRGIDRIERWDAKIKKYGKQARVQVKGLKHAHLLGYTWLELTKDDGSKGWLYGKADVLAIRLPDKFEIYRMNLLRKLVDEKVDKTKPILKTIPKKENGENDYEHMRFRQYNGYNRRDDVTVIVSLEDIEHCKVFTMKYDLEEVLNYDKEISCI